jgi:ABC-2 type transport system ATP-binding protein
MRALIRELSQSATVIVSTHILQEVQAVCERVLILRAGRKAVDSRLDELQRDTRLLITLDRDVEAVRPVLGAVDGVSAVTVIDAAPGAAGGAGRYRFALQATDNAAPAVAAAALRAGFALYELTREQRTLETVFAEVNAVAPAAASSASESRDAA